MRVRHRIPSIFNLSMVDVLCCALGCVILLWLLNLREAKQHEDTAGEQARRSAALLTEAQADRDGAYALLADRDVQIAALEEDRARTLGQVQTQAAAARDLEGRLRASAARAAELEEKLRAAGARAAALEGEARAGTRRGDDL